MNFSHYINTLSHTMVVPFLIHVVLCFNYCIWCYWFLWGWEEEYGIMIYFPDVPSYDKLINHYFCLNYSISSNNVPFKFLCWLEETIRSLRVMCVVSLVSGPGWHAQFMRWLGMEQVIFWSNPGSNLRQGPNQP